MNNEIPPPLSEEYHPETANKFRMAANTSILAVVLMFVITATFEKSLKSLSELVGAETMRFLAGGLAILAAALLVLSFVSGIVALFGIRRHGAKGLLGKGITGVILSLLVAAIAVPNFLRARQSAEAQTDFRNVVAHLRNENIEDLDDAAAAVSKLETVSDALTLAAGNASGQDAAMMQASAAVAEALRNAMAQYEEKTTALQNAAVLDCSTVTEREDLLTRKQIVANFMKANTVLTDTISSGIDTFERELRNYNLSKKVQQEVMIGFKEGYFRTLPYVLKIRNLDHELGETIIAYLDLLDSAWGQWSCDEPSETILLDTDSLIEKLNVLSTRIDEITVEQTTNQERLLEAQKSGVQR